MLRRTSPAWSETLQTVMLLISWTVDRIMVATGLEVSVALAFDAEATSLAFFALGTLLVGGLVGSRLSGFARALLCRSLKPRRLWYLGRSGAGVFPMFAIFNRKNKIIINS